MRNLVIYSFKEVLFINGELGLRVLDHVLNINSEIILIFINSSKKRNHFYKEHVKEMLIKYSKNVEIVEWNKNELLNYKDKMMTFSENLIATSVLFGHKIPNFLLQVFNGRAINLHPSLLPSGKGAHPIPWAIIDGAKQGVSIHLINEKLDEGDLIFQKEVEVTSALNSETIYDLCMAELFSGYLEVREYVDENKNFPRKIEMNKQYLSSFHKLRDLDDKSKIYADEIGSFSSFVSLVQANDFGIKRSIRYIDKSGTIWKLKLLFENDNNSSEVI